MTEHRIPDITKVAVIGGGASGLATARCLLGEGMVPTVFEQSTHIGGIWSFDETLPEGGSPAYRSLHTNTPKQLTAFSEFPFPANLPDFPSHDEVIGYLSAYAAHFGLDAYIRYETRVLAVTPAGGGRWMVQAAGPSGVQTSTFDAVFVCSGMFGEPLLPHYPGLAAFDGPVLHSRSYTDATPFAGQRVLVIGTGSSGSDIAVEVGQVAPAVWLSGRNNAWTHAVPPAAARPVNWRTRLARHLRLRLGHLTQGHIVRPDAPFVMQRDRTIMNARLRAAIQAGTVKPKPGIDHLEGHTVYFSDGTYAEVDVIIGATGYALRFPFLDRQIFRVTQDGLDLYRAVLHPDWPTLAFIGMSRVTGAIMPFAEMQARWAARVLRGAVYLPPPAQQHAAIAARQALIAARHGNPFRIALEPYMDLLAAEIGVLPRLWRHPLLWRALLGGKFIAARYRLDGPGRSPDAARILRAGNRPPAPPAPQPASPRNGYTNRTRRSST